MAKKKTAPKGELEEVKAEEAVEEIAKEVEVTEEIAKEASTAGPRPLTAETPLPCMATVAVPLAIIRKAANIGTSEQLKPVATLKKGTKVTVKSVNGDSVLLSNGLWGLASCFTV